MSQASVPPPQTASARGAGRELWLLRAGPEEELATSLAGLGGIPFAAVLCAPTQAEESWAAAFATRAGAEPVAHAELAPRHAGEEPAALAARAWSVLERALANGNGPLLAVLSAAVLGPVVAHALGFPFERAGALRVDPGRAVLLRDDPVGIVLRRSNVRTPGRSAGMPLPGGRAERQR